VTVSASTLQQCVAGGHTPSTPKYSLHPHEAHLLLQLGCVRCYCAVLGDVKGALLFCRAAGRMRIWTSCGAAEPSNDGMKEGEPVCVPLTPGKSCWVGHALLQRCWVVQHGPTELPCWHRC
jgi:hypothetical protein